MSALRLEGRERVGELKISAIIKEGQKNESKGLVWGQNRRKKRVFMVGYGPRLLFLSKK